MRGDIELMGVPPLGKPCVVAYCWKLLWKINYKNLRRTSVCWNSKEIIKNLKENNKGFKENNKEFKGK